MRGPRKYAKKSPKFEVRSSKSILAALAMAGICCDANVLRGAPSAETYGRIPSRNLFGLHEPVVQQPEPPKVQLPKVTLTGITTMEGKKLAYGRVQNSPKAGEQQGEQSFTLGEGQREGGIEILEINERLGTVRIINSGTEMTIGFDKDAGKVASAPPPGPAAGIAPATAPPNIAARLKSMNPGTSGYHRMIPTQTGQQGGTAPPPPAQPNLPLIQQQQYPPAEKPLTPDEQAILRELEQAAGRPK